LRPVAPLLTVTEAVALTPDDYHVIRPEDFGAPGLVARESVGPFTGVQALGPLLTVHDSTIEAIVRGDLVAVDAARGEQLELLVAFAHQVREVASGPAPEPSAELSALLAGPQRSAELDSAAAPVAGPLAAAEQARHSRNGREVGDGASAPASITSTGETARHLRDRPRRIPVAGSVLAKVAGIGLAYKAAGVTAAAAVLVATAGMTDVAPRPVNKAVQSTLSSFTPFDFSRERDEVPKDGAEVDSRTRARSSGEVRADVEVADEPSGTTGDDTSTTDDDPGLSVDVDLDRLEDVLDPDEVVDLPDPSDLSVPTTLPDPPDLPVNPPSPDLPELGDLPFLPLGGDDEFGGLLDRWR
jgi:hypothetical protein